MESIVHDHQQEYYEAINYSNDAVSSTVFIEFMLSAIKASLIEAAKMSGEMSDALDDKKTAHWKQNENFLDGRSVISNADVRKVGGDSSERFALSRRT